MKNTHEILQQGNEQKLRQLFQGALSHPNPPSFEATLQRAKGSAQSQTRVLWALAAVVLLVAGGWVFSSLNATQSLPNTKLTPITPSAPEVGGVLPPPASLAATQPAPQKLPASMGLTQPSQPLGWLEVNTFPLIGLRLFIDGKDTNQKTPVLKGIPLSPGEHSATFFDANGESFGPYPVKVKANETTRRAFHLTKEPPTQKTAPTTPQDPRNGTLPIELGSPKKSKSIKDPFGPPKPDLKKTRAEPPEDDNLIDPFRE